LEQWNDSQPRSGVYTLQQPTMQPVFDTRQTGDVLLQVAQKAGGNAGKRLAADSYLAFLKNSWKTVQGAVGDRKPFDAFWLEVVQKGGAWQEPRFRSAGLAASAGRLNVQRTAPAPGRLTLVAYPSSAFLDGRGANRPWLQELPDPVTKITWS